MEQCRYDFEALQAELHSYGIVYEHIINDNKPTWHFKSPGYNFNVLGDSQDWKLATALASKVIKLAETRAIKYSLKNIVEDIHHYE